MGETAVRRSARLASNNINSHSSVPSSPLSVWQSTSSLTGACTPGGDYSPYCRHVSKRQTSRQLLASKAAEEAADFNTAKNGGSFRERKAPLLKRLSAEYLGDGIVGFKERTAKERKKKSWVKRIGVTFILCVVVTGAVLQEWGGALWQEIRSVKFFEGILQEREEENDNRVFWKAKKREGFSNNSLFNGHINNNDDSSGNMIADNIILNEEARNATGCANNPRAVYDTKILGEIMNMRKMMIKVKQLEQQLEKTHGEFTNSKSRRPYDANGYMGISEISAVAEDLKKAMQTTDIKLQKLSSDVLYIQSRVAEIKSKIDKKEFEKYVSELQEVKGQLNSTRLLGREDSASFLPENKVDWALEALGSSIVQSETVSISWLNWMRSIARKILKLGAPEHMSNFFDESSNDGISEKIYKPQKPEIMIDGGGIVPGKCFAFHGQGNVTIRLPKPVYISEVGIDYPPPSITPFHESAPQDFTVYGEISSMREWPSPPFISFNNSFSSLYNSSSSDTADSSSSDTANSSSSSPSSPYNFALNNISALEGTWVELGRFSFVYPSKVYRQTFQISNLHFNTNEKREMNVSAASNVNDASLSNMHSFFVPFKKVKFAFSSNHGGAFTCIYRLRVFEHQK